MGYGHEFLLFGQLDDPPEWGDYVDVDASVGAVGILEHLWLVDLRNIMVIKYILGFCIRLRQFKYSPLPTRIKNEGMLNQ